MDQYFVSVPQNDPRLFSNVSHPFSLVDLGKRLLDASKNGDVEEVTNLMNNGAPFTADWLGISPLHFSAMNGHLSTCEALLKAGISRDARTKVDRTPLHLAAQEGHADIVELLLKNDADLDAKDMLLMTALHWAAERGHSPVVQVLMRYGANPDLENKFEMTPLYIAEQKGHMDACEAMLNAHHNVNSLVGKMAAPDEDITNVKAYIVTDEETFIPAAPPADEVTVTTALSIAEKCLGETGQQTVEVPSTSEGAHNCNESIPLRIADGMSTRALSEMMIEMSDGQMLYVCQHPNKDTPGLAVFNGDGTQVNDTTLLSQVYNAIDSLQAETENLEGNTVMDEKGVCDLTTSHVLNRNFDCIEQDNEADTVASSSSLSEPRNSNSPNFGSVGENIRRYSSDHDQLSYTINVEDQDSGSLGFNHLYSVE